MKNEEMALPNELLRYERERRNWSREYVAERVGVPDVRMVGRWEREGVLPHPDYRQKLCELYGRSARELGFVEPGEVPFWNVLYRRNPLFTGRETLLTQVHESLTTEKTVSLIQVQAISGLGGIGKTQVALEYAYRYGQQYQAVLWVRAESRDVLTSDFAALATLLNLPQKQTQDQSQALAAIKGWLAALSRWLLILDNVEDLQLIGEFLPLEVKGQVLLTTRLQAGGPLAHLIQVEVMEPEEGTLFLLRRAGIMAQDAPPESASYADWVQARAIAQAMGGLPLALDQAGAYIEETQCGLAEYLARYQTHGSALLRERGETASDHPEAVVGTFLLSLEKVGPANPAAADLLRLCAFLHPDAIPEEIFTGGAAELGAVLGPAASDSLQLDTAIKQLLRYSLLRRNREARTLSIHRLVQAVLKESLDEDTQRLWAERAVRAVNKSYPTVVMNEISHWAVCERYQLQALICASFIEDRKLEFAEAGRLLEQLGIYLQQRLRYKEAERILRRALAIKEYLHGKHHSLVAHTLDHLALCCYFQYKNVEARTFFQRSLEIEEQAFGPAHPQLVRTLIWMGHLAYDQELYREAESLYKRAQAIVENLAEPDLAQLSSILNGLGLVYYKKNNYVEAEAYLQRTLTLDRVRWTPDHPNLASALASLARLYTDQGRYSEAETLFQQALDIREHALGPSDPSVASTFHYMARMYQLWGRYSEAESSYKRAMTLVEQTLGLDHPMLSTMLSGYIDLLKILGKTDEAMAYRERLADIRAQIA